MARKKSKSDSRRKTATSRPAADGTVLTKTGKSAKKTRSEAPRPLQARPGRVMPVRAIPTEGEKPGERHSLLALNFPIVGIGASAGGLEAFTQLLDHLPSDTGMAFVLVQHLDPKHESILTDLLSRTTKMPVSQVKDGMPVEPNHVYVIPPNTNMAIVHGVLQLVPRTETRGQHMPIDYFLRTLAEDQGSQAIGVILSGTASDGALGLEAIKAEGGITFVQDEKSAKYSGIPRSAIAASRVDFILPPEGIAKELARIGRHPYVIQAQSAEAEKQLPKSEEEIFGKIFMLLRNATGVDFTHYKYNTLKRRILRRMALHKFEKLDDYLKYLKDNHAEVEALYQEILIKVTGFFREPEAFDALKREIFPKFMANRPLDEAIRLWVPGCATGEEVYSLAICLLEFLDEARANAVPIQIFATDISEAALEKARTGLYIENIALDVSPERLRRFFVKVDGKYQISKSIRDMCVFAKQNVFKDPPFSRLDLISCRNVLIYLDLSLQKKVMPIFHYALKPSGFLMLGSSETIGAFADLFGLIDKKHKIYAKKSTLTTPHFDFGANEQRLDLKESGKSAGRLGEESWSGFDVQKEADRIVLARYAPAGVLINDDMEILQFRGHTSAYLEPAPGKASLNLLKMAREGLLVELRTAIHKAQKGKETVKKTGIQIKHNGHFKEVNIEVIPIEGASRRERHYLILFEEIKPPESKEAKAQRAKAVAKKKENEQERRQAQLKQELTATREYLQSIIEEQEATNEELKSANEEILSSNEELQSTNEELETAKEELQSTNEELTTVNEELQNRNLELSQLNNDFVNLFASVNLAIIMLGSDLRIRRLTPIAEKVLNLIPADIGRPITDIKLNINVPDLEQLLVEVIDNVSTREREVQDREGRWYSLRLRPYRTTDNKIDGAVMLLVDIDMHKHSLEQLKESRDYAQAIVETVQQPLVVLDGKLCVQTANRSFYQTFQVQPEETEHCFIYELGNGQWNIPRLRELLEALIPKNTEFQDFEVTHDFPRIGHKIMRLNARRIDQEASRRQLILLAIEDVTAGQEMEGALAQSRDFYLKLFEEFPALIWRSGLDAKCNYFNQSWLRFTGRTLEQESGEGWAEGVHPEDLDRCVKTYLDAFAARQPFEMEYRLRRHDGEYRWIVDFGRPYHDLEGYFAGFIGSCYDITERKQAEEAIKRSAARLQTLDEISRARNEAGVDSNAIVNIVVRRVADLIGDACSIRLLSEDRESLASGVFFHPDPENAKFLEDLIAASPQRMGESLSGRVAQTGKALFMPEVPPEKLRAMVKPEYLPYLERYGVYSVVVVPMRVQGRLTGTLGILRDHPGHPYTDEDRIIVQEIADRVALALENARLFESLQQERDLLEQHVDERTAELRESEERFRSLANGSPALIWVNGLEGCEFVNRAYLEYLNVSSEVGVKGYDWAQYVHPEDREPYVNAYLDCFNRRVPFEAQFRFRRHDGEYRWMHSSGLPRFTAEGKFLGYVGSTIDITVIKQAEEALRAAQAHLQIVADAMPVVVTRCSRDLTYLWVNKAGEELLKRSANEIIGHPIAEILGEESLNRLLPYYQRVLSGEHIRLEEEVDYRDMGRRWVDVSYTPTFDAAGVPDGWVAAVMDITERKRMENELRRFNNELEKLVAERTQNLQNEIAERKQAEAMFRELVMSMPDAIVIAGHDGKIQLVNAQTEKLFGYSREALIGQPIELLMPERFFERHRLHRANYMAAPRTRLMGADLELYGRRADGNEFPVEISLGPVNTSNGVLVVAAIRDLTGRKQMDETLRASREQLRNLSAYLQTAREQERTHIAREIHDELGQALTALKMDVSWLGKKLPSTEEAMQTKIYIMTNLLESTIHTVQRISAELRPGLLDDLGLAAAIDWQAKQFHQRTGIACQFIHEPENIVLDRERSTAIFRILQEALTNVARHAQATKVKITLSKSENKVVLKVRDNGRGISSKQISDARSFGLMGMRERIHPWKGNLKIKGRTHKGTVVYVSLPVEV